MSKRVDYSADDFSKPAVYQVLPLRRDYYSYGVANDGYYYWYGNAVVRAFEASMNDHTQIFQIVGYADRTVMAMYLAGRRVYHHSEAPPRPGEETE